jgi:hypothetical protein
VDFNTIHLFGTKLEALPPLILQGIRSKDKASVTSFIEKMHHHMASNNAFGRAEKLKSSQGTLEGQIRIIKSLDHLVGEAGDLSKKKCSRRQPQWYSIDIVQKRLELSYLNHYLRGLR